MCLCCSLEPSIQFVGSDSQRRGGSVAPNKGVRGQLLLKG